MSCTFSVTSAWADRAKPRVIGIASSAAIHVVEGNHDRALRHLGNAFCSWNQLARIRIGGQGIVLCHYAMRVWQHSSRGAWHLYGHSHGNLEDDHQASLSMDGGVDAHQFLPWHFDEIKAVMEAKSRAVSKLCDGGKEGTDEQL